MKTKILPLLFSIIGLCRFGGLQAQFLNLTFDNAYNLEKGQLEFAPVFTNYYVNNSWTKGVQIGAPGARLGIGIAENFDLKIRFERLFSYEGGDGMNSYCLEPKVSLWKNFAFRLPLQLSTYSIEKSTESIFSTAPQLLYTHVNPKNSFDLTFGVRSNMVWESFEYGDYMKNFMGFSIGLGLGPDLNNWAIRPEIGLITDFKDAPIYQFGVAACFKLAPKKKEKG